MILPLEQQVTSLELSKKLKEVGCSQDTLFYWVQWGGKGDYFIYSLDMDAEYNDGNISKIHCKNPISAYTVAELGELLPFYFIHEGIFYHPKQYKLSDAYMIEYLNKYNKLCAIDNIGSNFTDETEANTRARMLIYLIENKLIKLNEKPFF